MGYQSETHMSATEPDLLKNQSVSYVFKHPDLPSITENLDGNDVGSLNWHKDEV